MNTETIKGSWKQLKGKAKERWGKLTDDDLDVVAGRRDELAGKIQERYGVAKEEAHSQLAAWARTASDITIHGSSPDGATLPAET